MISGSNVVSLRGNLVADPEIVGNSNNIAKFGLAVSYAGSDSDNPDNKAGFFNCVSFLNNSQGGDFLKRMINEDKLSKGSSVEIVGALSQERWKTDQGNRSRVVIVVEHFGFASGGARKDEDGQERTTSASNEAKQADAGAENFLDF